MGNLIRIITSEGSTYFTWGEGRMLTQVQQGTGGRRINYTYSPDGLRTKKAVTENGVTQMTEYVWGSNGLAGYRTGTYTVIVLYDQEGSPVGFTVNHEPFTYVKNLQGDVIRILDTNGNTVVSYTYDPWGVPAVTGDTLLAELNPCSYRGYDYDEETGYYYLQSRYYDPEIGRFINADEPLLLGASGNIPDDNLFSYCGNNPASRVDSTGESWTEVIDVVNAVYTTVNWAHTQYNKSLRISGYIYNQTRGTASKYWFGFYRSSHNGCGWIATYNALIMLGNRMEPYQIISRYEKSGAVLYGSFGVLPYAVISFFKAKGYKVTTTYDSANFDKVAKKNKVSIIWYWHSSGAHFVALRWNGSRFVGYNTFSNSSGADNWGTSILSFMSGRGYGNAMLISIS